MVDEKLGEQNKDGAHQQTVQPADRGQPMSGL